MIENLINKMGYMLLNLSEHFRDSKKLTLVGDRAIEWSWVVAKSPKKVYRALDLGPGDSNIPFALSLISDEVFTLDINLQKRNFLPKNIIQVVGDIISPPDDLGKFDLIINCSTIEHVGIPGRYGSRLSLDGDIVGMKNLLRMLRNGGSMLLTIPVGQDGIFEPNHRVYGKNRLPRLLEGFKIVEERYFGKSTDKPFWHEIDKEIALSTASSHSFYSIGLFELNAN
jgi:SAM-dependent methyltransferase